MLSYRLYFFGRAGRIVGSVELVCGSDEEALTVADAHADGRPMELWQQARMVRAYPGEAVCASAR